MASEDRIELIDIRFISEELWLYGTLHMPPCTDPPVVIGSHGLASDGNSAKQIDLANECTARGIAYFRFHHRGCGPSNGKFSEETTIFNRKKDLIRAVETVVSRKDTGNRFALFGSSMGAATCISVAQELPAEGYVLVAPPVVGSTLTQPPENLESDPELSVEFYNRLRDFDLTEILPSVKNVLIFHGDNDNIVSPENSRTLFQMAGEPKKLIIQNGGDHRMSRPDHQKEFIEESVKWLCRCFDLPYKQ